jgi:hypothetical protein
MLRIIFSISSKKKPKRLVHNWARNTHCQKVARFIVCATGGSGVSDSPAMDSSQFYMSSEPVTERISSKRFLEDADRTVGESVTGLKSAMKELRRSVSGLSGTSRVVWLSLVWSRRKYCWWFGRLVLAHTSRPNESAIKVGFYFCSLILFQSSFVPSLLCVTPASC